MPRTRSSVVSRARHRKIIARAKGYRGRRKNVLRVAAQAVVRAGQYSYRDRRQRKRQLRSLWIIRINAAARERGLSYSRLMAGLKRASIALDRRMLADLAVTDKAAFTALTEQIRAGDTGVEGASGSSE